MFMDVTITVMFLYFWQLRETVFQFAQKELAPKAQRIDRDNEFTEMRVLCIIS